MFDSHINEKVNKAYNILGIIKRNFYYLSGDCFVTLYKSLVRSHLEYANCVWSPHYQELIKQESHAVAKITVRCAQCTGDLKMCRNP